MYEQCEESQYSVDYSAVDVVTRYFSENGADLINVEYSNEVYFTAAVKKYNAEQFEAGLINRLNGRVKIKKIREYYFPFKL